MLSGSFSIKIYFGERKNSFNRRLIKVFIFSVINLFFLPVAFSQEAFNRSGGVALNLHLADFKDEFKGVQYGTFNPKKLIVKVKEKTEVRGIPNNLLNTQVISSYLDRHQFFYQAFCEGIMSKSTFDQMDDIDTTKLTSNWIDSVLSVVVGNDEKGNIVIIPDTNNDENFADEKRLILTERSDITNFSNRLFAETEITFDYFENGNIKKRTVPLRFMLKKNNPLDDLDWYSPVYRKGQWKIRDTVFQVALESRPVYHTTLYDFFYVDLNQDGVFDTSRDGMESYSISSPFNIKGMGWKITGLSADGSSIEISETKEPVLPKSSLKSGSPAPAFDAKTIDGKQISSESLKGKYILLDFWAAWCPYCRSEIAYLKKANNLFDKEKFAIVGVVSDDEISDSIDFIKNESISWLQIHQSLDSNIPKTYRVHGFPTQYLINPQGVIVATGDDLRGEKLIQTLTKFLSLK